MTAKPATDGNGLTVPRHTEEGKCATLPLCCRSGAASETSCIRVSGKEGGMQKTPRAWEEECALPSSSCTYADFGCILICYLKEQKKRGIRLSSASTSKGCSSSHPSARTGHGQMQLSPLAVHTAHAWLGGVPQATGKAANQCSAGGTVLVKLLWCPQKCCLHQGCEQQPKKCLLHAVLLTVTDKHWGSRFASGISRVVKCLGRLDPALLKAELRS